MSNLKTFSHRIAQAILGKNDFLEIPDGQGGIERVGESDLAAIVATEVAPLFSELQDAHWALLQSQFSSVYILGTSDKALAAMEQQWRDEQRIAEQERAILFLADLDDSDVRGVEILVKYKQKQ